MDFDFIVGGKRYAVRIYGYDLPYRRETGLDYRPPIEIWDDADNRCLYAAGEMLSPVVILRGSVVYHAEHLTALVQDFLLNG